jgi:uncharacterized protein YjbI with pentapeptide repeats
MSPQVTAAIIAAGVGVLTVTATVAVQISGRRATSRDTQKALDEQRNQLDRTLEEQRKQLDRTLAEQRTRTLNERFATAAGQLGSDKPPAVRLAGVYAMAGLADDWPENRQTCVDVLCGYLRMPYEPDPGDEAPGPERLAFRASREVRHTVIRVITAHLKGDAAVSWQGLNLDFTGAVFDGGNFAATRFSGGIVLFTQAEFSSALVGFDLADFSGALVSFDGAKFSGGTVSFNFVKFTGAMVSFDGAEFSGGNVTFDSAEFTGALVSFSGAEFPGGRVSFIDAEFPGGRVSFIDAEFSGGAVGFDGAEFSGGNVSFDGAKFIGGAVSFVGVSRSLADVLGAKFPDVRVRFDAKFSGGAVDFSDPGDWSTPPAFPWRDTPPPGVKLPTGQDQSQA